MKNILINKYAYDDHTAEITATMLEDMDDECKGIFSKFFNGEDVGDFSFRDHSINEICDKLSTNVISAIIYISYLKQDYDKYDAYLKRGIM